MFGLGRLLHRLFGQRGALAEGVAGYYGVQAQREAGTNLEIAADTLRETGGTYIDERGQIILVTPVPGQAITFEEQLRQVKRIRELQRPQRQLQLEQPPSHLEQP